MFLRRTCDPFQNCGSDFMLQILAAAQVKYPMKGHIVISEVTSCSRAELLAVYGSALVFLFPYGSPALFLPSR